MIRYSATLLAVLLAVCPLDFACADEAAVAEVPGFLQDGDRVVFLGNTLIEREQKYGYWETMLTARYPDRNITFRNLGWDGDTVWADSRGIFDPPAAGYARMLEQIKGLKPTVIFLGYGNNEAFAGKAGLDAFVKQYEKLLDDLRKCCPDGVRFVILLPLKYEDRPEALPSSEQINKNIQLYADAIRELADRQNAPRLAPFFRVEGPQRHHLTSDGIHLTEHGYRVTAGMLALGRSLWSLEDTPTGPMVIENGKVIEDGGFEEFKIAKSDGKIEFTAKRRSLEDVDATLMAFHGRPLGPVVFKALPLGEFHLRIDGQDLGPAPIADWDKKGTTAAPRHPDQEQYEALRRAIIAKNELYFHSWRPQNVTYLFGFRKHEQGQNAKETTEFEKLVAEKEAEIAKLKKPVPHKYELVPAKNVK